MIVGFFLVKPPCDMLRVACLDELPQLVLQDLGGLICLAPAVAICWDFRSHRGTPVDHPFSMGFFVVNQLLGIRQRKETLMATGVVHVN